MRVDGQPLSDACPRAVACDAVAVVDGETVLVAKGCIHVLNPTAAAIWERCDGSASVDRLAAELAGEYDVAAEVLVREVHVAITDLLERGLVGLEGASRGASEPRMIVETTPSCSGCGHGPNYEEQLLIDAGAVLVSIGCDGEVAAALEHALGSRVVGRTDPRQTRPSYGVVTPPRSRIPGRHDLARLHRGPDVLLASRRPERVLSGLLSQVASHDPPTGHTVLEALAVGHSGRVVVLAVPANRVRFERAMARHGLEVSDAPVLCVESTAMTVAVGGSQFEPSVERLHAFAAARPQLHDEIKNLSWGDYEVMGFGVEGDPGVPSVLGELGATAGSTLSSGSAFAALLAGVASRPILSRPSPDQIAELIG